MSVRRAIDALDISVIVTTYSRSKLSGGKTVEERLCRFRRKGENP